MAKPKTPEMLAPDSTQAAEPRPEQTVAGPDGQTTLTQEFLNTQRLNELAGGEEPAPDATAAGGSANAVANADAPAPGGDPAGGAPADDGADAPGGDAPADDAPDVDEADEQVEVDDEEDDKEV